MKLQMNMPLTNNFIVWFNKTFCSWGQMKVPCNSAGKKVGSPAPLWYNEYKLFFKLLFVACLLCVIIFVGGYVAIQFYNNSLLTNSIDLSTANTNALSANNAKCVKTSFDNLRSWFIVIGSAILFFNGK
jgi:hypothetical protein